MIGDAIKSRLGKQPFRPFVLRMGSGEAYTVPHPEMVSLSPGGRHLILWVGEDRYVDLDVLLVESVEQANGNGKGKRRAE